MDSLTQTRNSTKQELTISVKEKNYEGDDNVIFTPVTIGLDELKDIVRQHNYSLIVWKNGKREKENFHSASGFVVDVDKGMTFDEAKQLIIKENIFALLVTTRKHTDEANRFRVIVPTDRVFLSMDDYESKMTSFQQKYFPMSDSSINEGGRFLFYSPEDAVIYENFSNSYFDADFNVKPGKNNVKQISDAWNEDLKITLKDGSEVIAAQIDTKQPIYCPFHSDTNASAFLGINDDDDNQFIHCSTCKKTYWKSIDYLKVFTKKCANYYSYLDTVYEAHLSRYKLIQSKLGKEKFFIKTNAVGEAGKQMIFEYLVSTKHILSLETNYISDPEAGTISYKFNEEGQCFEVSVPPIAVDLKDNEYIEKYLEEKFGK